MELYLPPINAKLGSGTEFRECDETFRRRSIASKKRAIIYWSDRRHHQRVNKTLAKPVDVYDLEGNYLKTYPSSKKAAEGLFPDKKRSSVENGIKKARMGKKKSYYGYMFRDHKPEPTDIDPIAPRKRRSGYHVNRKADTYFAKRVRVHFDDGDTIDFDSIKACASALHGTRSGIFRARKEGRKYLNKYIIEIL